MSTIPTTQPTRAPAARAATTTKKSKPVKAAQIERALRAALSLHDYSEARWQKLIKEGADDETISHHLVDEFGSGGGSQTEDGLQFAYKGLPEPLFWLGASSHFTTMKPTLSGKPLVRRVREVMSIPLPAPAAAAAAAAAAPPAPSPDAARLPDDLIAQGWKLYDYSNGDWCAKNKAWNLETPRTEDFSFVVANARYQSEQYLAKHSTPGAHEFKSVTWRNGRCGLCNQPRDTDEHRAFRVEQRARELAGQPKQTADAWTTYAQAKLARVAELRANPFAGKKLTPARTRDWQAKLTTATEQKRWGMTMQSLAQSVVAGTLPPVLNGLTNEYQVRTIMDCVLEGTQLPDSGMPQNMGPTVKTAAEFAEAVKALAPLVPVVEPYTVDGELQSAYDEALPEPATNPAPVAEVFYVLDFFEDGTRHVAYLGSDTSLADLGADDRCAVIGVNAEEVVRVVSRHNLHLTPEEIVAEYGDDERLLKPHKFKEGEEEDEANCCDYQEFEAIHRLTPETPSEGAETQSAATPVTDAAPVAEEPFDKEIEVELNEHDIAVKSKEEARLRWQIEELEAEKKETDSAYKKKIGGLEEEAKRLSREIHRGRATLELQVVEHRDYERKVVEYLRADTRVVVESRPMRPREYQQPLPIA